MIVTDRTGLFVHHNTGTTWPPELSWLRDGGGVHPRNFPAFSRLFHRPCGARPRARLPLPLPLPLRPKTPPRRDHDIFRPLPAFRYAAAVLSRHPPTHPHPSYDSPSFCSINTWQAWHANAHSVSMKPWGWRMAKNTDERRRRGAGGLVLSRGRGRHGTRTPPLDPGGSGI